ncbi:MAG: LicD family protein [Treponema sp.]|jgi:lipopolysaccharide cholinephosphotransferase|nr:LicD family protein [Treponema sp.]
MFSDLDKLHKVLMEILEEFTRICDKHGLMYFFVGGTLLGAVRYKGFIPWDDDVDVAMPRNDYERFIAICQGELSPKYFLQCGETIQDWWKPFVRIRKNNTLLIMKNYLYKPHPHDHYGIFIDVFPLDNADSENSLVQCIQKFVVKKIISMIETKRGYIPKNIFKCLLLKIAHLFTYRQLQDMIINVLTFNKNKNAKCLVNITGRYSAQKETVPKEVFFPPVRVEFEEKWYNAPNQWDFYLRRIYGDNYMIPPPEMERSLDYHSARVVLDTREEKVDFDAEVSGPRVGE